MTWWGAMAWAQDLTFANYSDWRLPTFTNTGPPLINCSFSGPVCGSNVDPASSELAELWFVSLGNVSYYDTSGNPTACGNIGYCFINRGPFINTFIQDGSQSYWLGTECSLYPSSAWNFNAGGGQQFMVNKSYEGGVAWAVRDVGHAELPMLIAKLVPCAGPVPGGKWKNHGQYVSAVTKMASVFVDNDLITEEEADAIVSGAAKSKCGK